MSKNKLEELIKKETQGPSIGEVVTGALISGLITGAIAAAKCIFSKQ